MKCELYLLRHGIAVQGNLSKYPDDDRPLSDEGRLKMAVIAKEIVKRIKKVDAIYTSPLLRAHETAEIVAQAFSPSMDLTSLEELTIGGSTKKVIQYLIDQPKPAQMLVGHEPGLCDLVKTITSAVSTTSIVFHRGSLIKLSVEIRSKHISGTLDWALHPDGG